MRVTMCQTVDVSINDVLAEFGERMEEAEQSGEVPIGRVYLPLVDFATRLLARIPSKAMVACKDSQRAEVVKRLKAEAERWNEIYVPVD